MKSYTSQCKLQGGKTFLTRSLQRRFWVNCAGSAGTSKDDYVNLRNVSRLHQTADTSLESLYGDTAVWIQANNGRMGRRQAASLWRLSQAM